MEDSIRDLKAITGVYKIQSKKSGKIYIGSSVDIDRRKREHFHHLVNRTHSNSRLQEAFDEEGIESFIFEVVEVVERTKMFAKEQEYISIYNSFRNGFNGAPGTGWPSMLKGEKLPTETKLKISKAHKGKVLSEEHKRKIGLKSIGRQTMLGKHLSEEHKKKFADKNKIINQDKRKQFILSIMTPAQAREMIDRYKNGETMYSVRKAYGLDYNSAIRFFKYFGLIYENDPPLTIQRVPEQKRSEDI